jgi:enoyl-CoA hydratase
MGREEEKYILSEKRGPITLITLNRAESLNAFNRPALDELEKVLQEFEVEPSQRVAILTGAGEKAFCVGADIKDIKIMSHEEMIEWCLAGSRVFNRIARVPKAVVAAINGYALGGGCELALSCDFRIASDRSFFGQPEISLGWIPGWGGSKRLAQLVGVGKAKELLILGNRIPADEALKIGLVNQVVPSQRLMDAAIEFAQKLAEKSPLAVAAIKSMLAEWGGSIKEEAHFLEAMTVDYLTKTDFARLKIKEFEEKINRKE